MRLRPVLHPPTFVNLIRAGRVIVRVTLLSIALALSAALIPVSAQATAEHQHYQLNIPRQSLDAALMDFAKQTGLQIARFSDAVEGSALVGPVTGDVTVEQALHSLLDSQGLSYRVVNDKTIAVVKPGLEQTSAGPGDSHVLSDAERILNSAEAPDSSTAKQAGWFERVRLAQNEPVSPSDSSSSRDDKSSQSSNKNTDNKLEEIIVTAQKREERLQDVPVPVTAIAADTLVDRNQLRLQDYYTRVPGLSLTPGDLHGTPQLTIRGLTTGPFTNPTVSIVVDDVPYGSSSTLPRGEEAPDIDPSDLAHVEVLRGPQGTLYGASSIGGLLKFVTVDPSTDGVSGRVQGGVSSVYNGDEAGYNVRGAINVPLSDTLAVRASAFTRRDPGYIDNVQTGQDGVNRGNFDGGRLSALWRPSDVFSAKLSAMLQHSKVNGASEAHVQSGLGDLQQDALRGTGFYERNTQAYSATLTAKLGRAELTSVSGYNVNDYSTSFDYTYALGGLTDLFFGVPGTPFLENSKTTKFTQEIRLSAPIGQRFDWLLGAFYTDEDTPSFTQHILAVDPATGAVVDTWLDETRATTFSEYAAFTDLTFHVTDRFDIQIGGRESQNRQTFTQTQTGPFNLLIGFPTLVVVQPESRTKDNSFTYLVTPRFKVSPDLMVYARLASGYRAGGPNVNSALYGTPASYKPDKTQNYEIGVKGNLFGRSLSFDASLYYIDWKDLQILLLDVATANGYYTNADRAKSQGVELALESRPLTGLTVSGWVAWNDAVLSEDFPTGSAVTGASGDRLPLSSRFSGHLSLDQEFPLASMTGFVGGSLSYMGDREGVFVGPPQRQIFPAFAQTDVRAGVRYDSWTVNFFVNNVADKRAIVRGGIGAVNPTAYGYIQPRTAGLSVSKTF